MSIHTVGISTAILIPIAVLTLVGFIWWNSELARISLGKSIVLETSGLLIGRIEWYPLANGTYEMPLTVRNNGTYTTKIKITNTPALPTYTLTWNYGGQNLEINQTLPLLLTLKTASDFQNNTIQTFVEVIK